jgi:hypothetical protein
MFVYSRRRRNAAEQSTKLVYRSDEKFVLKLLYAAISRVSNNGGMPMTDFAPKGLTKR